MPAGDAVLAGCAAVSGACAFVDAARKHLALSLDALIARDIKETPRPSRSVLVLDDSDAARAATVHVLRVLGVPLITASTPVEARAAIRRDRPAVIVADYCLDGETCLALLRERPAFCRAVIVTGRVDIDRLAPLARAVSADLVGRPIDDEGEHALLSLVRSHLPTETP